MKKLTLLLLATFLTAACALAQGTGYKVGDVARDFTLKGVDGNMYSLEGEIIEGFIVIFTCNHCPYAIAYEDRIIELNKKYASLGYPVIAINPNDPVKQPDDSYEKMQVRAREKGFNFLYLYDETQEIAKAYGATRTPHVYLLDKNRVVRYIGAIDDNHEDATAVKEKYLENAINDLRNGKAVAVPQTKAIGCTIKWKA
ncbi:MAG: thioredoxin family protein [Saprospiraceae bacterium]|nr:thioredoxin family protein [Saprospiraceae bacterium]